MGQPAVLHGQQHTQREEYRKKAHREDMTLEQALEHAARDHTSPPGGPPCGLQFRYTEDKFLQKVEDRNDPISPSATLALDGWPPFSISFHPD